MQKILMIEDDELVTMVLKGKFEREGFEVEVATDGWSGYQKVVACRPDAVMLDLMLPGLPGTEVLRMIRCDSEFAELPVFAVSGADSADILDEAMQCGATGILTKGELSPTEIVTRVAEELARTYGAEPVRLN